jgi:surface polysaccharide O-acyltransferase-like enzyme
MSVQQPIKQREIWLDNLRIIATICVVIIHVSCCPPDNILLQDAATLITSKVYHTSVRFCVPLFVMISGSIQLHQTTSAISFYKKRIPRILLILWVWGTIYIGFNHIFRSQYNMKGYISSFLLGSTPGSTHLWFLYLITELYLITPLLWQLVNRLSDKKILFLSVAIICLFFNFTPFYLIGFSKTSWIDIQSYPDYVLMFVCFIPYYLLGKIIRNSKFCLNYWQVYMLITMFSISSCYTIYCSIITGNKSFHSYTSVNVLISTICLFCLFLQLGNKAVFSDRLNAKIANLSLGIYLIHEFVINTLQLAHINAFVVHPLLGVPMLTIIVFAISYYLSYLLKTNRFTKLIS